MDNEKQKDEIAALESIYNSEEFSYSNDNGHYQCSFTISINLPLDYHITYKDGRCVDQPDQKIKISYLPPLTLNILLPENYPSQLPPQFSLHSSWLYVLLLKKLCNKLDKLWEESKQEILFTWVAFLQDETLRFLCIQKSIDLSYEYTFHKELLEINQYITEGEETSDTDEEYAVKTVKDEIIKVKLTGCRITNISMQMCKDKRSITQYAVEKDLIKTLLDYNDTQHEIQFNKNFNLCKICFMDKLGAHCTQFVPCGHIYCKDCVSGYLEVKINDGNVQSIYCPEENCTSVATHGQIKDLVSSELFAKYDSLLLNVTIDGLGDITYCPRRNCQYPVSCEASEQLANCPNCLHAFCIYCKMLYHGIEPCKVNILKVVNEYENGSEVKKKQLERMYGKRRLQNMLDNRISETWVKRNSKKCPKCQVPIQKLDGCNKMHCWRCSAYFCWLCSTILDPKAPYNHYTSPTNNCKGKLFYGMQAPTEIDDDDDDDDDENEYLYY